MKYTLKTRRTTIRSVLRNDADSIISNINDRTISRYTGRIPYPYRRKDFIEWFAKVQKQRRKVNPDTLSFAIVIEGNAVGIISLEHIIPGHKAVVGYWLGKSFRGHGIMTEVVKAVTAFGFKKFKLHRIFARVFLSNPTSKRVLQKAGYHVEGIQRKVVRKNGRLLDCYMLAKVQ